jgi:hypothetical protein
MNTTPFPTTPIDVVALTVQEFIFDLDMNNAPSLDVVCRRFVEDSNRALVWLIRFRALTAWCARANMSEWLNARSGTSKDICEVAASFELNDRWEFDVQDFCCAVDSVLSRRSGTDGGQSKR